MIWWHKAEKKKLRRKRANADILSLPFTTVSKKRETETEIVIPEEQYKVHLPFNVPDICGAYGFSLKCITLVHMMNGYNHCLAKKCGHPSLSELFENYFLNQH